MSFLSFNPKIGQNATTTHYLIRHFQPSNSSYHQTRKKKEINKIRLVHTFCFRAVVGSLTFNHQIKCNCAQLS